MLPSILVLKDDDDCKISKTKFNKQHDSIFVLFLCWAGWSKPRRVKISVNYKRYKIKKILHSRGKECAPVLQVSYYMLTF